jgi:hypothetical protein
VKISSGYEESVSSDEAENLSNNSSKQPDILANSGVERPRFPFTGKPGINVDLEDPSNPLEYFELFCTPDTHHWKETNRIEIMKLLAFFLLQGLHQKLDNELFLMEENSGNDHIFGAVQQEEFSPSTKVS